MKEHGKIARGHLHSNTNVANDNLDELWYYVIQNPYGTPINVSIDMYGPANNNHKSGRVTGNDTIGGYVTRMYIYTVFTSTSSHDMAELCSVDIALNGNGTISSASNFRSLIIINMAEGNSSSITKIIKESVKTKSSGPTTFRSFYNGVKHELISAGAGYTNDRAFEEYHRIQFLFSGSNVIQFGTWVQSEAKTLAIIQSAASQRNRLFTDSSGNDFIDEFSYRVENGQEIKENIDVLYNKNQSSAWCFTRWISNVNTYSDPASGLSKHTGRLYMSWTDPVPDDTTPPDIEIWPEYSAINKAHVDTYGNYLRVFVRASDASGVNRVWISGYLDEAGNSCFDGGWATYDSANNRWYRDFALNNGDRYYYFRCEAVDNYGNSGTGGPVSSVRDTTPPVAYYIDVHNGWRNTDITKNVIYTDNFAVSGIAYTYDFNNWYDNWNAGTVNLAGTTGSVQGTWSAEGDRSVYFIAVDWLGNYSSWAGPYEVKIDKTNPYGTLSSSGGVNGNNKVYVTFSLTGVGDALSGVNRVEGMTQVTNGYQFTNIFDTAGTYAKTATIYDNAGNSKSFDLTITAYNVTFNLNGGSGTKPNDMVVVNGVAMPALSNKTAPTRTGYTFGGWYDTNASSGGTQYFTSSGGNVRNWNKNSGATLYARWTPVEYTITYDLKGGSVSPANRTKYTIETDTFTLNNPTKTGYNFAGWSGTGLSGSNNKTVIISKGSTGDRSYTANWTPKVYNIIYKDVGGGNFTGRHETGYPTTHTYGTQTNLKGATKDEHEFIGWFTNSSGTGSPITSLGATAYTSDITLYAKWKLPNPISVTAIKNLEYNMKSQTLLTVSNAKGDVYFSTSQLTSSNYTTGTKTIPSGINAGTYRIYWYVVGDNEYLPKSGSTVVPIDAFDLSKATIANITGTFTYDTEEHRPEPTVTVPISTAGKNPPTTLTKGDEFIYTYINCTNASTTNNPAIVRIEKNNSNYKGYKDATFQIGKLKLSNVNLASISNEEYNMREHKPNPNLTITTHNGNTVRLVKSTHYTCNYTSTAGNLINVGTVTVSISAAGNNVEGSKSTTFKIIPYDIGKANYASIGDISTYTYDTTDHKPTSLLTVNISAAGSSSNKTTLSNSSSHTYYTYSYGDTKNATQKSNNTKVTITAADSNYTGSISKNYTINPYNLSESGHVIIGTIPTQTYDSTQKKPEPKVYVPLPNNGDRHEIYKDVDFIFRYENNVNAGTNTATIKIIAIEKSNYINTGTGKFSIEKYDLSNATIPAVTGTYIYCTQAFEPKPSSSVTVPLPSSGKTLNLKEGTDFTYSWSDNVDASNKAKIIITAKDGGNYKGSKYIYFTINPYNLTNATIADITPEEYNMRKHEPGITVTARMHNSVTNKYITKTLTVGTEIRCDYDGGNINVGNDKTKAGHLTIYPNNVSPHNTNYTGNQGKYFEIYPYDLSQATINKNYFNDKKYVYDRSAWTPTPEVTVPLAAEGKTKPTALTANVNFKYEYDNNIHAGTATVRIVKHTDTNYTGSKSINFTIEKYDLSANTTEIASVGDLEYKMEQHRPTPIVKATLSSRSGKVELQQDTEFYINYGKNENVVDTNNNWLEILPKSSDFKGSKKVFINIIPYDLNRETTVIGNIPACTYDTLAWEPTPTVTVPLPPGKTTALTKNTHFTYSYNNNTHASTTNNPATVTITACHSNYKNSRSKDFIIDPYDLAGATIDNIPDETYNTLQHRPEITVTSNMTRNVRIPLRPGTEITVTYGANVNVGNDKTKAGTVTISPGPESPNSTDYTNSQLKYFTIEPYSLTNALIDEISDKIYNELQHKPTPTVRVPIPTEQEPTTIEAPTNFVFEYGANINAGIDAGSVTINHTSADTNYKDYKTVNFTIQKRPVVVPTAVNKEYYYNGLEQTFEVDDYDKVYDVTTNSIKSREGVLSIKDNTKIDAGLYTVTISIVDKNNNMWQGTPTNKIWTDEATADKLYPWRIHKINQELALDPDTSITIVRWNSTDVNYEDWGEGTVRVTSANPGIATIVYKNNAKTYYGGLNRLQRSSGTATITGVTPGETLAKYDMEETTNYFKLQREVPVIVLEAYYSITHGGKTIYYNKLEDAIAAAVNGDTIKVIKDATETTSNIIDKNITLDLMNNKITSSGTITIANGITVSIIGKTENGKSGGIENTSGTAIVNNGSLTLDKSAGEGIICAPIIKGTNLSINSANGTFNFYDGKLIGNNNLPYSGTAIYKPMTYIYTYKEGGLYISILKPDTTPPIITGEKPDKTLINVGTNVKININVTEPESGIRTEEFTEEDLRFFVGETEVTPSYVKLTYGFEYNGIYRYLLEFKGINGNGKLKIKVDKDRVYNLALLGNPEAIITENEITVDNTSATLSAEIRLVTPSNGISTDGNYQAEITRVSDENYLRDYEWEMKGPEDDDWKTVKVFNLGESASSLIGTVTLEGKYQIRVKVTDKVGNKAYSNVVEFEFRSRLDYNAKPSINFEKEIVSNTEVVIHAIVKSTTKLTSASVNGNAYSAEQITAGETVEGTWQIRTDLEYTANINTLFKFEVTDSQNNTTVATYAVTDISRKEANITYKIVDATAYENAKIEFHSQEDVLLTAIPEGFEIAKDSSTYGRDFKVNFTSEMQTVNHEFNFVNDIGTETVVHVEGNVETVYRNIRTVSGVVSELNSVKELKNVYGAGKITYERAKNLVLRMKNAKAVMEGTIKSYYGIDVTEINMRVSNSNDISVANILGGASTVQIKDNHNQVVALEKGEVEIITSAERGQLYSSNSNKTGVYFKEESLVDNEGTSGNSFHVTILNK